MWVYLCAGTMPSSWGDAGAFPSLSVLALVDNLLTGTLPATWGGPNAFPALFDLAFGISSQVGTLPPEWGSPTAYQQLRILTIYECNITGVCAYGPLGQNCCPWLVDEVSEMHVQCAQHRMI